LQEESTSLNKYISQTGVCSRREADKWIEEGRVKINGIVAQKGNRVESVDVVTLDDKPLMLKPEAIYIALHKPPGITCTTDLKDKDNIVDFVNHSQRLFHIGRLDKPSSGLIFMTNDGDIVNEILRAENNNEKEYIVTVDRAITPEFIKGMSNGVPILGQKTKKCIVQSRGTRIFKIILTQGLNRQIRRMCEYFNYNVVTLKRVRIMNITIDGLKVGEWRELRQDEINQLKKNLDYTK
jgi:23S rRNA pseudouridine2604 synthase